MKERIAIKQLVSIGVGELVPVSFIEDLTSIDDWPVDHSRILILNDTLSIKDGPVEGLLICEDSTSYRFQVPGDMVKFSVVPAYGSRLAAFGLGQEIGFRHYETIEDKLSSCELFIELHCLPDQEVKQRASG